MLGFVEPGELINLYLGASALVFPSLFGPDNLPPIECFAYGIPVAASALPGVAECLNDCALFFNPLDPLDIAEKIQKLLQDKELKDKLIFEAKKFVQFRTAENYINQLSDRLADLEPIFESWGSWMDASVYELPCKFVKFNKELGSWERRGRPESVWGKIKGCYTEEDLGGIKVSWITDKEAQFWVWSDKKGLSDLVVEIICHLQDQEIKINNTYFSIKRKNIDEIIIIRLLMLVEEGMNEVQIINKNLVKFDNDDRQFGIMISRMYLEHSNSF